MHHSEPLIDPMIKRRNEELMLIVFWLDRVGKLLEPMFHYPQVFICSESLLVRLGNLNYGTNSQWKNQAKS